MERIHCLFGSVLFFFFLCYFFVPLIIIITIISVDSSRNSNNSSSRSYRLEFNGEFVKSNEQECFFDVHCVCVSERLTFLVLDNNVPDVAS